MEASDVHGAGPWAGLVKKPKRRASITSAASSNGEADESPEKQEGEDYFPASRLFEYQWPLGEEGAGHYLLQEQVAEYLGARGIQRKYPDLQRRTLDIEERKYLVGRGAVTETLSNMGLVALRSEQVMEVMAADYPKKYEEFMDVVQEREFQDAIRRKVLEARRLAHLRQLEEENSSNRGSLFSAAVQQAAQYNSELARRRKGERSAYFDVQTNLLQVPRPELKPESGKRRRCRYPVALLPGQYSEQFQRYTAQQLRRLPVRTVLELPPRPPPPKPAAPVEQDIPLSVTETIVIPTESTPVTVSLSTSVTPSPSTPHRPHSFATPLARQIGSGGSSVGKSFVCSICFKGRGSNSKGLPEELLRCSNCRSHTHPSCLNMSVIAATVARTYDWQCLECKKCQVCSDPGEEDAMVFCDECDRGYHSFCVGLNVIPSGVWLCLECGQCSCCNATSPGQEASSKWKHEYASGKFIHTLCMDCSSFFRRGYFCPVCIMVYHNDESDSPMICCDTCDRWIHAHCDNIGEDRYDELSSEHSTYVCRLCRGEQRERDSTFHKKYRKMAPQ